MFGQPDDQFRIDAPIGEGAQAKVFSCTRLNTGKSYAAKRVNLGTLEMSNRAGKVRVNLNREIQVMQELTHPHIVNLLAAFWETADVCFIVMDLARGGNLHEQLVVGKGLEGPENASRHVSWQILQGLGYMHGKSVVHRDLKPANVLIKDSSKASDNGLEYVLHNVKISDFGLSRALNDSNAELDMTRCGTPAFAAPEVVTGRYDERADFWSFGCMIFAMLCGAYPFDDNPAHLRNPKKYSHGPAPIIECGRWQQVSENAQAIVRSLLTCDPAERLGLDGCLRHDWFLTLPTDDFHPSTSGAMLRQESASGSTGVFRKVSGWVGEAVDRLEFEFWSGGAPVSVGAPTGGEQYRECLLHSEEMVIAVRQEIRDGYLGNALVLFTSHCRVFALEGSDALTRRSFVAPVGSQIVGLQFLDGKLQGIHLENAPHKGEDARVARIEGHVGYAVDQLSLTLRDGSIRSYGNEGGDETSETALENDEYIMIVEQGPRDGYLGYSIAFYTSKMKTIVLRGMETAQSRRFIAPKGKQVSGFEFDGHRLVNVKLCPTDGDLSQESLESCDDGSSRHASDSMCAIT